MKAIPGHLWLGLGTGALALGMAAGHYRAQKARQSWQASCAVAGRKKALITGASSGIGAEFARQLSALHYDLILVARRHERLERLAAQLSEANGVQVEWLPADLTQYADVERVCEHITKLSHLQLLVNNAGFGLEGRFAQSDLQRQVDMIELHVLASVRLMRAALPGMIERRFGGIINVSSLAALVALPMHASYSATKSYLHVFSMALHAELRSTGVRVQALCPGFTESEMHGPADNSRRNDLPSFLFLPASQVVRESLNALEADRGLCIPGTFYKFAGQVVRIGPVADMVTRLMASRD